MKKIFAILLSFILLSFSISATCFAEDYNEDAPLCDYPKISKFINKLSCWKFCK